MGNKTDEGVISTSSPTSNRRMGPGNGSPTVSTSSSALPVAAPFVKEGLRHLKRPRSAVVVEPFQRQLYELIVRQLHHDGFLAAASNVADAASVSISSSTLASGIAGDRLAQLTADGLTLETLCRREVEEEHALHVVERYMNASKLYLPLHISSSWQVGGKMRRWRQKFTTSALGGVIRDVSYSPDGAYAACSGTNGLALIFSLRTLDDVVAVERASTSNRRRGLSWSTSTGYSSTNLKGAGTVSSSPQNNSDNAEKSSHSATENHSFFSIQNANEITDLCVARRILSHSQSVEVIRFHPHKPLVVSGSRSGELSIHNVGPPDVKREIKVQDDFPVRAAAWHPSGEYVLFGTDHPTPRLLSVLGERVLTAPPTQRTSHHASSLRQSTVGSSTTTVTVGAGSSANSTGDASSGVQGTLSSGSLSLQPHSAGLTAVAFASDGRTWCSASLDGCWAVCDGRSGKVIQRVGGAHSKVPVTSVVYSRTGNVLLTSGMDSTARLWDLRYITSLAAGNRTIGSSGSSPGTSTNGSSAVNSSRSSSPLGSSHFAGEVLSFGTPGKCEHRSIKAAFSSDESHILCQDADLTSIQGYCVYTGDLVYTLSTEPVLTQRGLAVSPYGNAVLTGGDDSRLRLWTPSLIPTE